MKLFFLLLLTISTCHQLQKESTSYNTALSQCEQDLEAKKKANPHVFFAPNSECMIGADLPIFHSKTIDEVPITPSILKGKVTIINFWSIHCPPCIAEMPGLEDLYKKYGTKKVNYIAISWENETKIRKFLKKHPWKFTQLRNGHDLIIEKFKMNWGFPTTFVLDENAVIVAAFSGVEEIADASKTIKEKLTPILNQYIN